MFHHVAMHTVGKHIGRMPFRTRRAAQEQKARKRAQKIVARKRKPALFKVTIVSDPTLPWPTR